MSFLKISITLLSYDDTSGSYLTPCIQIDKSQLSLFYILLYLYALQAVIMPFMYGKILACPRKNTWFQSSS